MSSAASLAPLLSQFALRPLAPDGDDTLRAQRGEMLGHDRLLELQRVLQALDGVFPAHQALEDADARGMRQRAEQLALHEGELRPIY